MPRQRTLDLHPENGVAAELLELAGHPLQLAFDLIIDGGRVAGDEWRKFGSLQAIFLGEPELDHGALRAMNEDEPVRASVIRIVQMHRSAGYLVGPDRVQVSRFG